MKKYSYVKIIPLLILISCATVETQNNNIVVTDEPKEIDVPIKTDENKLFVEYLENDWKNNLKDNPLFASYTGDKSLNDKINSNSIEQFIKDKKSDQNSLYLLEQFEILKLSKENQLNYKFTLESGQVALDGEGSIQLEQDLATGEPAFLLNEDFTASAIQTQSSYASNTDLDSQAGFDTASTLDDILDFTERNPFGDEDN